MTARRSEFCKSVAPVAPKRGLEFRSFGFAESYKIDFARYLPSPNAPVAHHRHIAEMVHFGAWWPPASRLVVGAACAGDGGAEVGAHGLEIAGGQGVVGAGADQGVECAGVGEPGDGVGGGPAVDGRISTARRGGAGRQGEDGDRLRSALVEQMKTLRISDGAEGGADQRETASDGGCERGIRQLRLKGRVQFGRVIERQIRSRILEELIVIG